MNGAGNRVRRGVDCGRPDADIRQAKGQLTGFLFNFTDDLEFNLFYKITSVLLPFFIWCVANWCITTLVDGEGSFGDIAMVTAYAVVPLVIIQLPLVLLSHVITLQEQPFYQILDAVSVLWFALLLFCGILTIHQFSVGKTILTIGIAVLGMVNPAFPGPFVFVSDTADGGFLSHPAQ